MISEEHKKEIEAEIRQQEYREHHIGKYECDDCEYSTNDKEDINDHILDTAHERKHPWID